MFWTIGTGITGDGSTWITNSPIPESGSWTFSVVWRDPAGNIRTRTDAQFTIATPVVYIDNASDAQSSNNWVGHLTRPLSVVNNEVIQVEIVRQSDNAVVWSTDAAVSGTSWNTSSPNPGYGNWIFSATWVDGSGNVLSTVAYNYTIVDPFGLGTFTNVRVFGQGVNSVVVQPGERVYIGLWGGGGGGASESPGNNVNDPAVLGGNSNGTSATASGLYQGAPGGLGGTADFAQGQGWTSQGLSIDFELGHAGLGAKIPPGYQAIADGWGYLIGAFNGFNGSRGPGGAGGQGYGGYSATGWYPDPTTNTWVFLSNEGGQWHYNTSYAGFGNYWIIGDPPVDDHGAIGLPAFGGGGGQGASNQTLSHYTNDGIGGGGGGGAYTATDYTNIGNTPVTVTFNVSGGGPGAIGVDPTNSTVAPGQGVDNHGAPGAAGVAVVATLQGNAPGIYITSMNGPAGQFSGFIPGSNYIPAAGYGSDEIDWSIVNVATGATVTAGFTNDLSDLHSWSVNAGPLPSGSYCFIVTWMTNISPGGFIGPIMAPHMSTQKFFTV